MNIESFCKTVWGLSYDEVQAKATKKEYSEFFIPKKSGKRQITYLSHDSSLFSLQENLKKYFEGQALPTCVKGFVKGENYISYLEPHIYSVYFLRVDIKDFFPSIKKEMIEEELSQLVYFEKADDSKKVSSLIANITTYNDCLPQGASTSPIMSNLVMMRLDQRILKYCQAVDVIYTRYADDILFSSSKLDFREKKWFLKKIKYILSCKNFKLNYGKIKSGTDEISLNGYVVSKEGIRLSRERLFDIKKVVSFSKTNRALLRSNPQLYLQQLNGLPLKHRDLAKYPFKNIFQLSQYLTGYRSYLISFLNYCIDPSFEKTVKRLLKKIEREVLKF